MIPDSIQFHEADVETIACAGDVVIVMLNRFSEEKQGFVAYGAVRFDGVRRLLEDRAAVDRVVPPFTDGELLYLNVKNDETEFLIHWFDYATRTRRDIQYIIVAASVSWIDA